MPADGQILNSQTVCAIKDDVGFCCIAGEMDNLISFISKGNGGKSNQESKNLIAAISVYDFYLYTGKGCYPLFKNITTKEVVIFGVTHGSVRKEMGTLFNVIILDEFDYQRRPYKNIDISPLREIIKSKLLKEDFIVSNMAHSIERSIEALVPFSIL